jgi:hypothetical protein
MATLTPTLTLTSTDITSDELSFSVTDSLTVSKAVIPPSRAITSTSDLTLIPAATYTKAYVYLKNVDASIVINVDFGTQLSMALAPGEFAFFPWDSSGNIVVASASATPYIEYAVFEA